MPKRLHFTHLQGLLLFSLLVAAGFEASFNYHTQSLLGTQGFRVTAALLGAAMVIGNGISGNRWRSKLPVFAGIAVLLGLPLLYTMNPSHTWVDGAGLVPRPYHAWWPASVYRGGGETVMWSALAAVGVLGTGARLPSRHVAVLLAICSVFAFGITVWALSQRVTPRPVAVHEWTGVFVSPNHFAAFACLAFPVACAMGAAIHRDAMHHGRVSSPAPFFYMLAGLLCWAVVYTGSRAGMAILLLQGVGMLVCLTYKGKDRYIEDEDSVSGLQVPGTGSPLPRVWSGRFHGWALLAGIVLLVVAWMLFVVRRGGVGGIGQDLVFRGRVIQDVVAMIRARPWWGMGPGSFAVAFPYYQSEILDGHYFLHAHNEPVQILAEWGALGAAVLSIGLWLILGAPRPARRERADAGFTPDSWVESKWLRAGLLMALAGLALHSLVDFPLRHPLLLLMASLWISLLSRPCSQPGHSPRPQEP